MGIEPTTSGATVRRSNRLSYTHHAGLIRQKVAENRRENPVGRRRGGVGVSTFGEQGSLAPLGHLCPPHPRFARPLPQGEAKEGPPREICRGNGEAQHGLGRWRRPALLGVRRGRARRSLRARQKGLEPPTRGLEGRCSIQLSYWRRIKTIPNSDKIIPNSISRFQRVGFWKGLWNLESASGINESGRADSNGRPPVPKTGALPGCATPRSFKWRVTKGLGESNEGGARGGFEKQRIARAEASGSRSLVAGYRRFVWKTEQREGAKEQEPRVVRRLRRRRLRFPLLNPPPYRLSIFSNETREARTEPLSRIAGGRGLKVRGPEGKASLAHAAQRFAYRSHWIRPHPRPLPGGEVITVRRSLEKVDRPQRARGMGGG